MAKKKNSHFMDKWLKKAPRPEQLSRFTVDYDKYDREDVQRLLKEMPDFDSSREKLADSKAGDLAYDVAQDLYLSFVKVQPELLPPEDIRPSHQVNRMVTEEAQDLPDHKELRVWTSGDDIGSALAFVTIEPDVETLYDRLDEAIKQGNEMDQLAQQLMSAEGQKRSLDEMVKDWMENNNPEDPQNQQQAQDYSQQQQNLQDMIDGLRQQMEAQGQSLQEALDAARPDVRQTLKSALGKAAKDMQNMQESAELWGVDPGELTRLPAKERIDLAKRLNSPKFKRVAELFGPMKRLAFTEQRRKVNYAREEIYDVELGNDLARVLPQELAALGDEDREILFYKDYFESHLPQYMMRGNERVAKGGIVYCHDGSGSMGGEREMWAKAVGLCLLHVARKQKRSFWGIQFGSSREIRVDDFRDTTKIKPEQVIDFAEFFFNGGTDFMTPLSTALKLLQDEHDQSGAVKSDIVFCTDGQCGIDESPGGWFDQFKKEQTRLHFQVWGIIIGGEPSAEPINKICDGKVATIKSLTSGESVREIFGKL